MPAFSLASARAMDEKARRLRAPSFWPRGGTCPIPRRSDDDDAGASGCDPSRLLADVRSMRRNGTIAVYCRAGTVLPHGVAVCYRWIIAGGPGAIVPSLSGVGVGPKAVARVGIVAVIAGAGIVAVIPMVGIVAVVIEGKEGIAITPPGLCGAGQAAFGRWGGPKRRA